MIALSIFIGIVWLGLVYVALSIKIVPPNEIWALYWLGNEWKAVGPGLRWIPFGFVRAIPNSTLAVQKQEPGEPEQVQRYDDKDLLPGQVRPVRINHPPYEKALYYSDDPNQDEIAKGPSIRFEDLPAKRKEAIEKDAFEGRITSEATWTDTWRLTAKGNKVFQFIRIVGSAEEVNRRLRDAVESLLQGILTKTTHAESLRVKDQIAEYIQAQLEDLVGENKPNQAGEDTSKRGAAWGIVIDSFALLQLHPGRRVNEALADVAKSKLARQEAAEGTAAERLRIEELATAEADATRKKAAALRELATVMESPGGQKARMLEVLETAFKNPKLIVAGEALSLVTSAREVLDQINSPTTTK